jgi:hypothetical protein
MPTPNFGFDTQTTTSTSRRVLSEQDSFVMANTSGFITYQDEAPWEGWHIYYQGVRAISLPTHAVLLFVPIIIYFL